MKLETKKDSDFGRVAVALRSIVDDFKSDSAVVLALAGDLGAGKTTLTKYLAKSFEIEDEIVSPTFVIMKIYPLENDGQKTSARFDRFIHIDAYRFEDPKEADSIRLHEIISDPKNLIIIEWPELLGDGLPDRRIDVKIEHDGEGRRIEISENK